MMGLEQGPRDPTRTLMTPDIIITDRYKLPNADALIPLITDSMTIILTGAILILTMDDIIIMKPQELHP